MIYVDISVSITGNLAFIGRRCWGWGQKLTSGLRLETRRTEWMAFGAMPWMAILPAIADEVSVRGPRAPGIVCMDRPYGPEPKEGRGEWEKERGGVI